MARECYKLLLDGKEYKLRLTLKGQKALEEKFPGVAALGTVIGAVEDLDAMEAVLTQALNWKGNENEVLDGAELYDLMVDEGYCGADRFLAVMLGIAHNAGMISEDDRARIERATKRMIREGMKTLDAAEDAAEVHEAPADPTLAVKTLDG